MEANKSLELARKAYPNDENLRVAYLLGLQKGAENLEEAVNDAKDLDIEKILNSFQNFYAHENSGEFPSAIEIARHFFELGMQQSKKHNNNEEDEKMIDEIIDYMKPMPIFFESTKGKSGKEYTQKFVKNAINWLKSLKERIGE